MVSRLPRYVPPLSGTLPLFVRRIEGSYGSLQLHKEKDRELSYRFARKGCENASVREMSYEDEL